MTASSTRSGELDLLVATVSDEYLDRLNRGEDPDVSEYTIRHPEIASLLAEILPALRSLRRPSFSQTAMADGPPACPPLTGTLGDFEIVREIGRGGMGVVYEARQISLGRSVALKTLPFASALVSSKLNRFRNEAQAAAQLHHSNIVPVFAVGTERGVWYYAMQLIQGRTLAEAISDLRSRLGLDENGTVPVSGPLSLTRSAPRSGIKTTQANGGECDTAPAHAADSHRGANRLADEAWHRSVVCVCIDAARALHHAHSMDIIHRDIKPGNLMVDDQGHLWVTDFGLARMRDSVGLTATGDIIGTLAYMSPEQACGDNRLTDHRVDVYSLGATLYELLTLNPPFEADNRAALLQRITNGELVPPRRLNPGIPVDLETIILKCLAHDPLSRYATAEELAEDLTHFLHNRPIQARRPTASQRLTKWAQRHRPLVAVTVAALGLLLVGLAVSTAVIATEKSRTEAALVEVSQRERRLTFAFQGRDRLMQQAEESRRHAEQNSRQARDVLNFFMDTVEEDLAGRPEFSVLRRRLLEAGLSYYQGFIEQADGDRALRVELAKGHHRIARILNEIGTSPEAREALDKALELQERLVRQDPFDRELRRELNAMYRELGTFSGDEFIDLACDPRVCDELQMGPQQIFACLEIAAEFHAGRPSRFSRDLTEVRRRYRARLGRATEAIIEALSKEQLERLRQIELQRRGNRVWSQSKVCEQLGLSEQQRQAIRRIDRDAWRMIMRSKYSDRSIILASAAAAIEDVLTPRQRSQWADMTGPPFDWSPRD